MWVQKPAVATGEKDRRRACEFRGDTGAEALYQRGRTVQGARAQAVRSILAQERCGGVHLDLRQQAGFGP